MTERNKPYPNTSVPLNLTQIKCFMFRVETLAPPFARLISFSTSFPLSPARVFLWLLLFAPHQRRSVGGSAQAVQVAVGDGLARLRRGGGVAACGLLAAVRLVVKVAEQDDEGDGVADEGVVHPVGEVAVDVERQGGVADGDVELDLRSLFKKKSITLKR